MIPASMAATGGVLPPPPAAAAEEEDLRLIRAVAQRDRRAFEALYDRLAPGIGRYAQRLLRRPELVDEVVNDVMLAIWQGAARFDRAAGRLTTWAFGIAHHKALKAMARARRSVNEASLDDPVGAVALEAAAAATGAHGPEHTLFGRQIGRALERALAALSVEHRAVLELAFAESCSYEEIAAITDCPVNTVKTRMFYARRRLARLLADAGVRED